MGPGGGGGSRGGGGGSHQGLEWPTVGEVRGSKVWVSW